ncbi:MAG TPA: hypothetical protein VNK23_15485 [Candidatus Dormibacteraeota bacterium]|nr:hypothetical protein [Candidatus Dormibacteraeota bacterium]
MKQRVNRFAIILMAVGFLLLASAAVPRPSFAGTLSTEVIGMFPENVGEFAYADMKTARQYSWFPQLREQLLPSRFRQFEQFLISAGVDPNTQVDELAWAAIKSPKNGEEIVGVALGDFSPASSEARFKQQKLPVVTIDGYKLYAYGSGTGPTDILFMFIDANTAAFGQRAALQQLIDVRSGAARSLLDNSQLSPLISEANGNGVIWAVLDKSYTHLAIQQLIPQAAQFPQAAPIINRMRAMTIDIQADSGIDAQFQAICNSPDDANLLAAGLQGALMLQRYQEAKSNPDLANALDQVHVTPSGDRLKVDAAVSQDQLLSLIRTRAFAVPM